MTVNHETSLSFQNECQIMVMNSLFRLKDHFQKCGLSFSSDDLRMLNDVIASGCQSKGKDSPYNRLTTLFFIYAKQLKSQLNQCNTVITKFENMMITHS